MGDVVNLDARRPAQDGEPGRFACQHMRIDNVLSATCGICGPMERVAS